MFDKMTNGYIKADPEDVPDIQLELKRKYKDICKNDFGVDAKVKVTIIPIDPIEGFTHKYKIRCRA